MGKTAEWAPARLVAAPQQERGKPVRALPVAACPAQRVHPARAVLSPAAAPRRPEAAAAALAARRALERRVRARPVAVRVAAPATWARAPVAVAHSRSTSSRAPT